MTSPSSSATTPTITASGVVSTPYSVRPPTSAFLKPKEVQNESSSPTEYGVPASTPLEVQRSYARLKKGGLRRTELRLAQTLIPGFRIKYKCELAFWTGSFKERGALNFLLQLTPEQREFGVIAASAGNHALALAYHGKRLGINVSVVMPSIAPLTKISRCREFEANVIIFGEDIGEAREHALQLAKDSTSKCFKQVYVNGFDDPRIVSGAGTCGLEIMDQWPDVEAIVVPIGGAGLIAGVALAVKQQNPSIKIIGVESTACPSFAEALRVGKPVKVATKSTLADGLKVPQVGGHSFSVSKHLIDEVVLVDEEWIALAVLRLLEREKMVVEGGGAIGVAAILSGKLDHIKGMKTCIVLGGGNIDITMVGRVIERGLHFDKRSIRFTATISDKPGGLAKLTKTIAECGGSVKDIVQERPYITSGLITTVRVQVETEGAEQTDKLMERLRQEGFRPRVAVVDKGDLEEDEPPRLHTQPAKPTPPPAAKL